MYNSFIQSDASKVILCAIFLYLVVYFTHIRPKRKEKEITEHKSSYENDTYKYLDADAKIVDIKTEKYYFTKLYKGFKTIVTFSDGFKYLSTDANYAIHMTYSTISVGQLERLEIANKAIAAHNKAYEKLYGVVLDNTPLRKEVPCLLYCKNCRCVYSGTSGRNDGIEACPDCRRKLLPTTFPVDKWRTLTDDDKKKVLAGFSLGYGLEISNVMDKVMK